MVPVAGGGFLLAILWMDLLFDLQVLGRPDPLPEAVLASIAGYYRHVTTDAAPLHLLIAAVMMATVAATAATLRSHGQRSRAVLALLLVAAPVALGLLRVFPNAIRLGTRADPVAVQSALARAICHEHLLCLAAIAAFLLLHLGGARQSPFKVRPTSNTSPMS